MIQYVKYLSTNELVTYLPNNKKFLIFIYFVNLAATCCETCSTICTFKVITGRESTFDSTAQESTFAIRLPSVVYGIIFA